MARTAALYMQTDVYLQQHECPAQFFLEEEMFHTKTKLTSLAILFHFLCAQHVSDINISIIRSLRLFC